MIPVYEGPLNYQIVRINRGDPWPEWSYTSGDRDTLVRRISNIKGSDLIHRSKRGAKLSLLDRWAIVPGPVRNDLGEVAP